MYQIFIYTVEEEHLGGVIRGVSEADAQAMVARAQARNAGSATFQTPGAAEPGIGRNQARQMGGFFG